MNKLILILLILFSFGSLYAQTELDSTYYLTPTDTVESTSTGITYTDSSMIIGNTADSVAFRLELCPSWDVSWDPLEYYTDVEIKFHYRMDNALGGYGDTCFVYTSYSTSSNYEGADSLAVVDTSIIIPSPVWTHTFEIEDEDVDIDNTFPTVVDLLRVISDRVVFTFDGLDSNTVEIDTVTVLIGDTTKTNTVVNPDRPSRWNAVCTWTASVSDNVQDYWLAYGIASDEYYRLIDVGDVTSYTIDSLSTDTTYYFAVATRDDNGLWSEYSNEDTVAMLEEYDPPDPDSVDIVPPTYPDIYSISQVNGTMEFEFDDAITIDLSGGVWKHVTEGGNLFALGAGANNCTMTGDSLMIYRPGQYTVIAGLSGRGTGLVNMAILDHDNNILGKCNFMASASYTHAYNTFTTVTITDTTYLKIGLDDAGGSAYNFYIYNAALQVLKKY